MNHFWKSPELDSLVLATIGSHHPDLADAKIACIFTEKASKSAGRAVPGKLKKFPPRLVALLPIGEEYDYLLEVAFEIWNDYSPHQKNALVHHLLCFAERAEDEEEHVSWKIRRPDVEAFISNIREFGNWNTDLELLNGVR
jgi:hypothetical protein